MVVRIRHHQALEFVGSPILLPKIPEFWYLIVGIRLHWLESDLVQPDSGQKLGQIPTKLVGIWFVGIGWRRPDVARFQQRLLDFILRRWWFFSYEPNDEKYFLENHFLWTKISLKMFYDG